jgi:RHS repeat-associated protein
VDLYQPVTITQNGTQLTVDDPVQYVPPPTETLNYDADGNLKTDGRWTYAWDAADRLIKMESIAFVQNAVTTPPLLPAVNVSAKVIEFAYDGLSRRIRKKVTEGVSTIAVWEAYVYDGWNMVLSVKLNPAAGATQGRPQSAIASNVWAPDLGSQPFARRDWQKAGGVRGLVLANYFTGANGGGIHVPGMDPMGNVTSVTRLGMSYSAGESPGPYFRSEFVYDYDAFGKETRSSTLVAGLNPDSFPFHFSTKFTDPESGFNYYGYRFYDPANGRWLNRDPIGEKGGMNLYRTVRNNLIRYVDRLGLDIVEFRRPANIPIVGRLADHSTVEVDIDSPDPSNPGKPTSTSVDTNSNGTTVTDLNAKPSQNPKNKLQESERIPATNEEGKAVTEAARGPKSPLPTKGSYQWPADDCGETIDHLKNILNDYRNMPRNDFRDKYGLPQDPSHPPKTPPLPPPLDGIGTFDGVVQGP